MSRRNGFARHATLYDFRDLDLMLKIEDRRDEEGWVEAADLASSLGFGDDAGPLSSRLSWMRRFGMLEYDEKRHLWRLSAGGRRVAAGRLKGAQARTIEAIPDEAMIDVIANVTSRYWRGDPMTANLLRREFAYGTHRKP